MPGPKSHWRSVSIIPESGTLKKPIWLYYRNILDAIKLLLVRPDLVMNMDFIPKRVWTKNNDDSRARIFNDMFTGNWAWRTQVSVILPGFL